MKFKETPADGNIFRDIGFPPEEAEHLLIRSMLMTSISQILKTRKLTQAKAAALFGVTQPRVSDLVRGKIHLFSIDTLVDMLSHAGMRVRIVTEPSRGSRRVA